MSSQWSFELGRFLATLRHSQNELLETMRQKSLALRELDEPRILQLVQREEELARNLKELLRVRQQVLANAQKQGWTVSTLTDLVRRLPAADRERLEPSLESVREAARLMRQESWTQWVVSHRCSQHAAELVALVAGGGEVDPTYGRKSRFGEPQDIVSAAMLDAEV